MANKEKLKKMAHRYEVYRAHDSSDSVWDNKRTPIIRSASKREALAKSRKYLKRKGGGRSSIVVDSHRNEGNGETIYKKGKRTREFEPWSG